MTDRVGYPSTADCGVRRPATAIHRHRSCLATCEQIATQPAEWSRHSRITTTDSRHSLPTAPNLLDRNFTATAPNQIWVGDVTYIATDEGWLRLAVVLDLFSRRIVGWSLGEQITSEIVIDALRMAWLLRCPEHAAGLIFHSDRGSQYASYEFAKLLKECGITPSMSGKGKFWDNANCLFQ